MIQATGAIAVVETVFVKELLTDAIEVFSSAHH